MNRDDMGDDPGEWLASVPLLESDELPLLCRHGSVQRRLLQGMTGAVLIHSMAWLLLISGPRLFPREVSGGPEYVVRLVTFEDAPADPLPEPGSGEGAGATDGADTDGGSPAQPVAMTGVGEGTTVRGPEPSQGNGPDNELAESEALKAPEAPGIPPAPELIERGESPPDKPSDPLPDKPAKLVEKKAVVKQAAKVPRRRRADSSPVSATPPERSSPVVQASAQESSTSPGPGSHPSHDPHSKDGSEETVGDGYGQRGAASEKGYPGSRGAPGAHEYQLAQVDKAPELVKRVEPDYPTMARRRRLSGRVVVKFVVDSHGEVRKASVLEAAPPGVFDNCVLEAVARWRFKPGTFKGKPVSTWVVFPIQFRVSG